MFATRFISLIAATAAIMSVTASPFVARDNQTASDVVDPASALAQSELAAFNAIDITSYTSDLTTRGYSQPSSSGSYSSCSTQGCNEQDILSIFNDLKVKVSASVALMDGYKSPIGPCNTLISDINYSIKLLGAVRVNKSTYGSSCQEIVSIICEIIAGILGCLSKYTLWTVLFLCIKLDIVFCALIKACITLIPGVLALIVTAIKPHVAACTSYGFTTTLKACGLY